MEIGVAFMAGRIDCGDWCLSTGGTTRRGYAVQIEEKTTKAFVKSQGVLLRNVAALGKPSKWATFVPRVRLSIRKYPERICQENYIFHLSFKQSSLGRSSRSNRQRRWSVAENGLSQLTTPKAGKSVEILVNPDSFNKQLLSKIPLLKESYERPLYLGNCHVETIFAAFFRSVPRLRYRRECLRMADGGTVSLDWPVSGDDDDIWGRVPEKDAPVLILLPGLTGGSHDDYVRNLLIEARKVGWRGVVFNSRGCANSPVTSAQFYSASFTEDLRQVVKHVGSIYRKSRIYGAGWSLGANILVRYMGEEGESCPLSGGVSLCNPFNLVLADENFQKGFNRIYDRFLAGALGKIFARHAALFEGIGGDFDVRLASNAKSVREFDHGITKVSFGFKTVDEYYYQSSSSHSIKDVRVPLLCIQADDDPIALSAAIPRADIEANENCALIVTPAGGHLGWVAGPEAPFGGSWTDPLVMDYLILLDASVNSKPAFEESKGQGGNVQLVRVETREEKGRKAITTGSQNIFLSHQTGNRKDLFNQGSQIHARVAWSFL